MGYRPPKPLHGRTRPITDPVAVVVGGRCVAVAEWSGTDWRVVVQGPGLVWLSRAQCEEAAGSLWLGLGKIIDLDRAYDLLVAVGMPRGGWEAA